jgi:transcriptional regulator with XRE-family HTH domain
MKKSELVASYERLRRSLIESRRKAGLTQQELANRLKRPQSFVSKYENGERRLEVIEFVEICRALKEDPGSLLRILGGPEAGA